MTAHMEEEKLAIMTRNRM